MGRAMRCGTLLGLAAVLLSAFVAQGWARCAPGAIGTSREITIDATGGPRFGGVQYGGNELLRPGEVVLTFDDGPHRQLTPVVLDILDQHCARATFFLVGQRAMGYADLVRETARRGHTIATHTWSHPNLRSRSPAQGIAEIELGISAVNKALGRPAAPFFRFPYLSDPPYAIEHLRRRDTAILSIDIDSFDFRTRSPTVVLRNVMQQLNSKGRGIILFHDIQPSTAGALGALLTDLKAGGYRIVHLVPRQGQATIAEYDQRVGTPSGAISAVGRPLAQRTVVAPAWEPRTIPQRQIAPDGTPRVATVQVASPPAAAAQSAEPRQRRRDDDDDWRRNAFGGR